MPLSRRQFLHGSGAGGIGLLTFVVAGCEREMTPAQARTEKVDFKVFDAAEVAALEALGEQLVPGSATAGLSHFIDHQLAAPPDQQLLMIKFLGVPAPWLDFYRGGLAAAEAAAQRLHQRAFSALAPVQAAQLAGAIVAGDVAGWDGPPPGFFAFVLRSDAVDVTYGTQQGFESLSIPYMAHITPPSRWGE